MFAFPCSHWRRLRTFNVVERPNKEIKRRTRLAGLSPHETSLLRLVFAVLIEHQRGMGSRKNQFMYGKRQQCRIGLEEFTERELLNRVRPNCNVFGFVGFFTEIASFQTFASKIGDGGRESFRVNFSQKLRLIVGTFNTDFEISSWGRSSQGVLKVRSSPASTRATIMTSELNSHVSFKR